MGKVVYLMNVSLDGFINTPEGSLEWATVDDELHRWFNEQSRGSAVVVYGRRLYETMAAYWPTAEQDPNASETEREYARIWNPQPKVVFSRTLERVDWNSRLVRDDVVGEIARLKAGVDGEIEVGGPTLARDVIRAGLVDEYRMVVHPVVLGAGTRFFPDLDVPIGLRLIETKTFGSGATYLGYEAT